MRKKVLLVGAGENCEVIENILRKTYAIGGYLDDEKTGKTILGKTSEFKRYLRSHVFFVSIGNNGARKKMVQSLRLARARFAQAIHPLSSIEKSVTLGDNLFIGALTYINVNSVIEDAVFINNGCIIEHDNVIGAYSHLAPGVITGGGVIVGKESFIGLGTCVNDHITIGHHATIGSGSVVITNIQSHRKAVGVPTRYLS